MCDSDYDYRSEQAYSRDMLSTGDVLCDCGTRVPADDMTECAACGRDACPDCIRDTLSHLKVCCSDCELQVLEQYLTSGAIAADWQLSNQPDWRARAQAETDAVAKRIAELNDAMLPELVSRSLLELGALRDEMMSMGSGTAATIAQNAITVIRSFTWRARAQAETDTIAKRIAELSDAMLPELVSRSLFELGALQDAMMSMGSDTAATIAQNAIDVIRNFARRARKAE